MAMFGMNAMNRLQDSMRRLVLPAAKAVTAPTGFALNGSTNPKLKAMLSRVAAGTGRGKIVFKADSTFGVGEGSGATINGYAIGNARPTRVPSVLAAKLTAAGYPTLDRATVGDNSAAITSGSSLPTYDTRVSFSGTGGIQGGQNFAGGGFIGATSSTPFIFTLVADDCDTFRVDFYNSNSASPVTIKIDGAAPTAGPSSTVGSAPLSGFYSVVVKAAALGTHTLELNMPASGGPALRGVVPYKSSVAAIDIIDHGARGATSANQAATNGSWLNNEALAFDVPDLTVILLGFNDMNTGVSGASYKASVDSIVAQALASGDVLLLTPYPAGSPYNNGISDYVAAINSIASSRKIAVQDLQAYFGGSFTSALAARMFDGLVHGKAEFYAECGDVVSRAILAMAA